MSTEHSLHLLESIIDICPEPVVVFDQNHTLVAMNTVVNTLFEGVGPVIREGSLFDFFSGLHLDETGKATEALYTFFNEKPTKPQSLALFREERPWRKIVLSRVAGECFGIMLFLPEHPSLRGVLGGLDKKRGELLGIAAHDLRSPLHKFSLSLEMLEDERTKPDQQKKFIGIMKRGVQGMRQLIDDILDITKIDSGKIDLHPEKIEVAPFIKEVCEFNRYLAEQKSMAFVVHLDQAPQYALFDPRRAGQVINNLLSNAVKFSNKGTTITVEVSEKDGAFCCSVTDQGPGIEEEDLAHLFVPFGEYINKPTGGEQSTGLGLTICQKIVELHGGTLDVDSTVGKGSTFTFTLPQA